MKKCPHCKQRFGFKDFLTKLSSDTLAADPHPPGGHKREHRCFHCKAKFWICYEHAHVNALFNQYLPGLLVTAGGVFGILKFAAELELFQSLMCTVIFLFLAVPLFISFVKYQACRLEGK